MRIKNINVNYAITIINGTRINQYIFIFTILAFLFVGCSSNNNTSNGNSEFHYSDGIAENGFWEGVRANDYVNVEKFMALQIPSHVHYVSVEAIQSEIDDFLVYFDITESELTDDFVADNLSEQSGWSTVNELKEGLRYERQRDLIIIYVEQNLSTGELFKPIPDHLIEYIQRALIEEYRKLAEDNEMEIGELLSQTVGVTSEEELLEKFYEGNISTLIYSLVAQAIAENEGIVINKEDLNEFMATNFGFEEYSLFENIYGKPFLTQLALFKKVVMFVVDNAVLE